MRDNTERLRDIQEAITEIEKYSTQGKTKFREDELIQTWIIYHLQIIGEASRGLSDDFKITHSDINWRRVIDFRNVLIHQYFRIDLDLVWTIVEEEIPNLKQKINQILSDLESL